LFSLWALIGNNYINYIKVLNSTKNVIRINHSICYIFYLQDILDFIEQLPYGAVYFTFGSIFKMTSLPEHIKKALIDALAQIHQSVLRKYEDEIKNLPKNVMVNMKFYVIFL